MSRGFPGPSRGTGPDRLSSFPRSSAAAAARRVPPGRADCGAGAFRPPSALRLRAPGRRRLPRPCSPRTRPERVRNRSPRLRWRGWRSSSVSAAVAVPETWHQLPRPDLPSRLKGAPQAPTQGYGVPGVARPPGPQERERVLGGGDGVLKRTSSGDKKFPVAGFC